MNIQLLVKVNSKISNKIKKFIIIIILCLMNYQIFAQIAYVVNSGSQTLSRIELESNETDNVFAILGNSANRIAITTDHLYVVNSGDNNIQKIDKESGNTVCHIYTGASSNPYDILIQDDYAYITGGLSNQIYKLDLTTDSIIAELTVGNNPAGMAVWGSKLYVGNTDYASGYNNCSLSVVDLNEFSVINVIPTNHNPQFLISYNDQIHVSCSGNWFNIYGTVQVIDPGLDEVIQVLDIGGYTGSLNAANNGRIYVGDLMNTGIYAYDADDLEIIYNSSSPFLPGAANIATYQNLLITLGGEWGQNFIVNTFDENENLLQSYNVGLYSTDIKIDMTNDSEAENEIIPEQITDLKNQPNPFNPLTEISFFLGRELSGNLELGIYDLKGRQVKHFRKQDFVISRIEAGNERQGAYRYNIFWNGTDDNGFSVSSGIYFYRVINNGITLAARKCTLLK
jgi:hypothetical protein